MKNKYLLKIILILLIGNIVIAVSAGQSFSGTKLVILSGSDGLEGERITSPCIPLFEEKTGIKVEFIELSQSDLHTKLTVMFSSKSPEVDLLWTWAGWTAEFAHAGFLEDITDKLSVEEWEMFVPGALNAITYKGRRYGIPRFYSIRSFYWNKKLFKEYGLDPDRPPKTWDEFIEYAKKCTDPSKGTWGILAQRGSNSNLVMGFQEFLVRTGGEIVDQNDNILLNNDKGIEALQRMVEEHVLGLVDPAGFGISEGPAQRARWIQGNNAMTIGWAGDYKVSNLPPSQIINEVGVGIIPSIATSGAITGSEGYSISKYSKNKDAALEFLKFMSKPEIQKEMTLRTGWYPVIKEVFQDPEVINKNPLIKVAEEQSKFPTMRFAAPYYSELVDILGPEILSAINGVKTPKQALDDAAKNLRSVIDSFK